MYCFRIWPTNPFSLRAVSYFIQSFSPYAHRHTYRQTDNEDHCTQRDYNTHATDVNQRERLTLSLEVGFSITYLICPCTFSVHEASHVTLLS